MNKSQKKKSIKRKENKPPSFEKPDAKWYRSMKIWFGVFLGLVLFRFIMFFVAEGKIRTDDIWFRILLVTFGTVIAWWYVKKRDKEN